MSNLKVNGIISTGGGACSVNEIGGGFIRYDNGIQICYGIIYPTGNDQAHRINFAKPFNAFPSVMIQKSGQKGWSSMWAPSGWPAFFIHYDQNGFRMKATDWQSGMIYPWIAVGTWK